MPAMLLIGVLAWQAKTSPKPEALLPNIGGFHYKVSTKSPRAQQFFDQGLAMVYGYQYPGARRSFAQAAQLDPECAMAYWGVALANGPFINDTEVSQDEAAAALEALEKADKARNATKLERELIAAQRKRFSLPAPEDRKKLDGAYADAMRSVWRRRSKNANVGALFADALIQLRPWDQWTPDGRPQPGTQELVATLDRILTLDPQHPQALHLYIHTMEGSQTPEKAQFAADRLLNMQPSLSHMQHMPSHIYSRTGQWQRAIDTNLVAIQAIDDYVSSRGQTPSGITEAHALELLGYAAAMSGQSAVALKHYDRILSDFQGDKAAMYKGFDYDLSMPLEALIRFGKWEEVLAVPEYGVDFPISNVVRLGARAVAFAATGRLEEAKAERVKFQEALQKAPLKQEFGYDTAGDMLAVHDHLVAGEVMIHDPAQTESALEELRKAVARQDKWHYSEPPYWIATARHSLGAALVKTGKFPEAERVYREDLRRIPNNGWSLYGLAKALKAQGKEAEAEQVMERFKRAWAKADIQIETSCLCLGPK